MGRLQSFERTTVVQAARDLFWDKGFEATSLADLEDATGLRRSSLYHAFGSKRGLFDAAVEDYQASVIRPRLRTLTGPGIGRASLLAYFSELRSAVSALPEDSPRRGCLLVNCAAGLAGHDDLARQVVEGYRSELTDTLQDALRAAGTAAGGSAPDRAPERARTLASLGMSAMLLARVNATESVALLDTATEQIRSWFPVHAATDA
ncbi:TetR/AcrR family transcriptional regulator [Cryobacterium sp. Hz7]|uniref:TetR/AcrR family transcriptional regulator n=1 Tax=unclassified Cryobacterium TaxID=2649013 RepID=UPI000CE5348B|nr:MULTISPECIES: TetR/AcrR family transcriptional regulator [unclassified Cryobacterium]TFB53316.1 TetR/AcrR family transcriptional regulator [Cryobacterium sp. Sr3]TFB58800.1 TetR/AcrR family transcriptional regulator [Cryobacterium sp. Hz7]TFC34935.1 TetR/AcrR family transcriptional regulator [Cryobacterium sp. TMT2-14]